MRKFCLRALLFVICLLCFASSAVFAKEVTVTGFGADRQSALRDARRAAVEEVVGAFVDSRTLTENFAVSLDSIYTKSQGFVGKVTILREGMSGGIYQVQATVDVNANPDAKILQEIQTVVALNDPRIAVIILKEGAPGVHEERIESAITERLIEKKFTHIIDPKLLAGLQDARMLESLYDGRPVTHIGKSYGADFVVLGKCATTTQQVVIPDFKGGYQTTNLNNSKSEMTVKILRLDTAAILDTFTVEAPGLEFGVAKANSEAIKNMAETAAEKVDLKFRHIASRVGNSSIEITAAGNASKFNQLVEDLKGIPGVQNVRLREQRGNKAIISVDTVQSANGLIRLLRERTKLGIYVDSIGSASAGIMVS